MLGKYKGVISVAPFSNNTIMKALPLKTVQITFDYRTDKDLKEIMEQVKSEVVGKTKNVTAGCRGLRYSIRTIESTK